MKHIRGQLRLRFIASAGWPCRFDVIFQRKVVASVGPKPIRDYLGFGIGRETYLSKVRAIE